MNIQLKRGLLASFGTVELIGGEPAFILDTGKLYIGDGTTNVLVNPDAPVTSVASKTGAVSLVKGDVGLANVTNESKATMFTSPSFTGTPVGTTAILSDSTTKIATTAFVKGQSYLTSAPVTSVAGKTGAVSLGKGDVGLANVINESKTTMFTSPSFTGTPVATTQITSDSSTKIATTAFVKGQSYLTSSSDIDGGVF